MDQIRCLVKNLKFYGYPAYRISWWLLQIESNRIVDYSDETDRITKNSKNPDIRFVSTPTDSYSKSTTFSKSIYPKFCIKLLILYIKYLIMPSF